MLFKLAFRRVIADLSAAILLFILVLSSCWIGSCGSSIYQISSTTFLLYSILLVVAYMLWLKDAPKNNIPWLKVVGVSVLLGGIFLLVDLLFGFLLEKRETFFGALVGNGIGFGFTLMVFPGVTFMAISGWVRQKILYMSFRCAACDK